MSDHEQTIGSAAAKAGVALSGAGASATFLGLGAEGWALVASVATFIYVAIQILLCLPKLAAMIRRWIKYFRPGGDEDEAGA